MFALIIGLIPAHSVMWIWNCVTRQMLGYLSEVFTTYFLIQVVIWIFFLHLLCLLGTPLVILYVTKIQSLAIQSVYGHTFRPLRSFPVSNGRIVFSIKYYGQHLAIAQNMHLHLFCIWVELVNVRRSILHL